LTDLVTARHEDALLMAYDAGPLGDEEMKIVARRGRVVEISKTLDPVGADGENLGIVKFGAEGAAVLVGLLDQRVAAGGVREWAPHAFSDFARLRPLHVIGTRGFPWTEIDFPEDYERAINEILPAIQADVTVRLAPDTTIHVRSVRMRPDAVGGTLLPAAGE
jgi:choline kinase